MNRRELISSGIGLVALALIGTASALAPRTDRQRFEAQLKDHAVIKDQTFVIDDAQPINLGGYRGVLVTGCSFIWTRPVTGYLVDTQCSDCMINQCYFECPHA